MKRTKRTKTKLQEDFEKGEQARKEAAAQLSKNGVYFVPVHPHSKWLDSKRRQKNVVSNRVLDIGHDEGMGLDYMVKIAGKSQKFYVLIRWLSDPDIYIKETRAQDLVNHFNDMDVLFLFLNYPIDASGKPTLITHYVLWCMSDFTKQGFTWTKALQSQTNSNRLVLINKNTKINPRNFTPIPINGQKTKPLFGREVEDFWTSMKEISK